MNLRKFYRKIYTFVMVRQKPVKYAKKLVLILLREGYICMGVRLGEVNPG